MNIQSIMEHWPIVSAAIVIVISFGLHIAGKFGERTEKVDFFKWLFGKNADGKKENLSYLLYSIAFGLLGTVMKGELMELAGITKDLTYLLAVWYGGAHVVARWLGINAASKARKV